MTMASRDISYGKLNSRVVKKTNELLLSYNLRISYQACELKVTIYFRFDELLNTFRVIKWKETDICYYNV